MSPLKRLLRLGKLTRPVLGDVIERPRLWAALELQMETAASVWVQAWPGAGKTVLASSFVESRTKAHVWYSVDVGDRSPASFFRYMSQALCYAAGIAMNELPAYVCVPGDDVETFARTYFREAFQHLGNGSVLVLDNLQAADPSPEFTAILSALIEEAPDGLKLLCLSRSAPPQALTRLVVNGRISELDRDALRFSNEEVGALVVRSATGEVFDLEVIAHLNLELQGWAAGWRLVLQGGKDPPSSNFEVDLSVLERTFSYFAEVLFKRQSETTQRILLRLAAMHRFTLRAAVEVTHDVGASAVVEHLYRNNLFTLRHLVSGASDCAYELHPLLRRFLLNRAWKSFDSSAFLELLEHAAGLAVHSGDIEDVIALAIDFGAWGLATELIANNLHIILDSGGHRALVAQITRVPANEFAARPLLMLAQGASMMVFAPLQARAHLVRAFDELNESDLIASRLHAWCLIVDSIVLEWGNFSLLDRWIDEGKPLVSFYEGCADERLRAHFVASMFSALMFRRPEDESFARWCHELLVIVEKCPDPALSALLSGNLLIHHLVCDGDPNLVDRLISTIEQKISGMRLPAFTQALFDANRAARAMLRARQEESRHYAQAAERVAHSHGVRLSDFLIATQRAYASLTFGDVEVGRKDVERLAALVAPATVSVDRAHYHYLAGHLHMLEDDFARARWHCGEAMQIADTVGGPHQHALGGIAFAASLWFEGNREHAWSALQRARDIASSARMRLVEFQAMLWEAYFCLDAISRDTTAVQSHLQRALSLGASRDYLNFNWFVPRAISRLLGFAVEYEIELGYVRRFIRARALWPIKIQLFPDDVELTVHGVPIRFGHKRPRELLRLIAAIGRGEHASSMLPGQYRKEGPAADARQALNLALHRIRRLWGYEKAIVRNGDRVVFNPDLVAVQQCSMR